MSQVLFYFVGYLINCVSLKWQFIIIIITICYRLKTSYECFPRLAYWVMGSLHGGCPDWPRQITTQQNSRTIHALLHDKYYK